MSTLEIEPAAVAQAFQGWASGDEALHARLTDEMSALFTSEVQLTESLFDEVSVETLKAVITKLPYAATRAVTKPSLIKHLAKHFGALAAPGGGRSGVSSSAAAPEASALVTALRHAKTAPPPALNASAGAPATSGLLAGQYLDALQYDKQGVQPPPHLANGCGMVRLVLPARKGKTATRLAPDIINRVLSTYPSFTAYIRQAMQGHNYSALDQERRRRDVEEALWLARVLDVAMGQQLSLQSWDFIEIMIRRMSALEQAPVVGWKVASQMEEQGLRGSLVPLSYLRRAQQRANFQAKLDKHRGEPEE